MALLHPYGAGYCFARLTTYVEVHPAKTLLTLRDKEKRGADQRALGGSFHPENGPLHHK